MTRQALLIGINRYKIPGADLRGCVNDVRNMEAVLTRHCGFKPGDITKLTDLAATKKAMQAAIRDLVRNARKGDVLLLHYSGHGSNVPDANGDEADHRDEILCSRRTSTGRTRSPTTGCERPSTSCAKG